MRKLKVLHILPKLGFGGAERLVLDLVRFKKNVDTGLCILYNNINPFFEQELISINTRYWYLNKKRGFDVSMFNKILTIINDFDPDIVHTHLYVLRYALVPSILAKVPVIIHTVHNDPYYEVDKVGKIIHYLGFKKQNLIPVSISNLICDKLKKFYQVEYSPVIYNGVDTENFNMRLNDSTKIDFKKYFGIPIDKKIILHIGRFARQKNHILLVNAYMMIKEKLNDTILVLVGDGPERAKIESYVKDKDLQKNVFFLGEISNVNSLYQIADVFVLSSDWEGFPLVLLEAMSAGLPIVSTNVGGISEIIEDKVTGFLVEPRDTYGLASKIIEILKNQQLAYKIKNNLEKRAKEFDIRKTVENYEKLYLEMLKKFKTNPELVN
ncbi:N-acetyl-alpha-D-glucosaminyl L-malate synthase BshA [Carboxydocella thermautotrophica]|nr:N-acetyl-alpha-D-glucosaminyl L-malate synthase BshA [Carboxydocella thermautotrophica]